jgi:hypothetical protein
MTNDPNMAAKIARRRMSGQREPDGSFRVMNLLLSPSITEAEAWVCFTSSASTRANIRRPARSPHRKNHSTASAMRSGWGRWPAGYSSYRIRYPVRSSSGTICRLTSTGIV